MPTRSIRNLIRARARFLRRSSWRSKIRSTASETFRYSPSSIEANSQKVPPTRGMIDVPPPVRISKPFTSAVDLADARDEAEVVDQRDRAVVVVGREGDLELARQQLADVVAHEVAHEGRDVGSGVEGLVGADAGPRVAGHVADGVAAGLARERPRSPISRIALAASASGMWWNWKFCRVVMWPFLAACTAPRRRRRRPSARA